ncbi:MAG: hypothetical protein HY318_13555 [Armatimonadetes bacterium]|nr:hypothetical protein [Armatimonadota bacterium]
MKQLRVERLVHDGEGQPLVMVNLLMNVCWECGQESMPLESARAVEGALRGEMASTRQFVAPMYEMA